MGTNYYAHKRCCLSCGRSDEPRHVGKSSAGWCFSLHVYPEDGIRDYADWVTIFNDPDVTIKDEYGTRVSPEQMKEIVTDRGWKPPTGVPFGYGSWDDFYEKNHAVPGPRHLARSKIDGRRCIGHGNGTWDLMVGEFS